MRKNIGLIFTIILLASLAIWIASRWNVWFAKHPEPKFILTETISSVQLTVGDIPLNERIVTWKSRPDSLLLDKNAMKLIWVADSDTIYPAVNRKWIKSGGGEAIYFWSKIEVNEGEHFYAIESVDTITPFYRTLIDYSDSLSILVIGDVQDKIPNFETNVAVEKLSKNYNSDFILQLGDLIDRPHHNKWDIYFNSFAEVRTATPMIAIVGNHDYHKGLNKYPDERFFYTFAYFLNDENNAPTIGCCELNFGKTYLYILDSNQPIFRQFGQRKWLIDRLNQLDDNVEKILALHHPLRSARNKFNNLIVRWMYESIVVDHNIKIVLAGHEHTYHKLSEEETGGYVQIITNFSSKNYQNSVGESGRKPIELKIKR